MARLACVLAVAALLAGPAFAGEITRRATTKSYALTLTVGPMEAMYTAAEAKAKHPRSGEVMVGGGPASMGGPAMGGKMRHLELKVSSRATGKVVTNAAPRITLTDTNAMMSAPVEVKAVAMEGIGEGPSDFHYGNNVQLASGHDYKLDVAVKGEQASFTFHA